MTDAAHPEVVYLDHNATAPLRPAAFEAMLPYLRDRFGNASTTHAHGRRSREAIEFARAQLAALIGASPSEILFTSGGTESNNLAVRGVAAARREPGHIVLSAIEHAAVVEPALELRGVGWRVDRVAVDGFGQVAASAVSEAITSDTALVSVMLAHNETGSLQPVAAISAGLAGRSGRPVLHSDASQALGKVAVDVGALGVDLLTIAGHKLGGPLGVGALFVRTGTALAPNLRGAPHERGLRPGTENVPGIVGLGAAAAYVREHLDAESARIAALRDLLWDRLTADIPGLRFNGHPLQRLPNTLQVRFPGVTSAALLARCPSVAASTGPACHDGNPTPSGSLLAMGLSPEECVRSVRLSLGPSSTREGVEAAAAALVAAWRSA